MFIASLKAFREGEEEELSRKVAYAIQHAIIEWFSNNGRHFPWRETRDPYRIMVAEKLLQQTTARQQVVEAYSKLIERFPTIFHLSNADLRTLNPIFKRLGLQYRAKELKKMAAEIVKSHSGKIPRDLESLLLLPGIGDYSARAILCFAYRQPYPIVDTNFARFFFRVFGLSGQIPANPSRNRKLLEIADWLLPRKQAAEFNLGVLDLCSSLCKPIDPDCVNCPVNSNCTYGSELLSKLS